MGRKRTLPRPPPFPFQYRNSSVIARCMARSLTTPCKSSSNGLRPQASETPRVSGNIGNIRGVRCSARGRNQRMKTPQLLNYAQDRWLPGDSGLAEIASAIDGSPVAVTGSGGVDFAAMLRHAREVGGPALAQAHLPRARAAAESARPGDHGPQGGAVRAQLHDRRDPQGRLDRHRGRRRHPLLLLVQGPPRASRRACDPRRRDGALVEGRHLRRPAHLHAAPGRGAAHQRVQLPGVGDAGETGAGAARRGAGDRQAGVGHRLPRRSGVPGDDRDRPGARRRDPADRRRGRRHVRPSDRPGHGRLHRLGRDRAQASLASRRCCAKASASSPSRTASTPRSSAPTRRRGRPSSTCSSAKWRSR